MTQKEKQTKILIQKTCYFCEALHLETFPFLTKIVIKPSKIAYNKIYKYIIILHSLI